jgi:hypothetical protein
LDDFEHAGVQAGVAPGGGREFGDERSVFAGFEDDGVPREEGGDDVAVG